VPAIHDPNTNLTLWESGAIITYLIDKYDTEHKMSYATESQKYHCVQWQHYQSTGQGPYWGQAAWFQLYHPEPLETAKKRYVDEAIRIIKVLDKWLDHREWLVGEQCTYADLAFVSWSAALPFFMAGRDEYIKTNFPNFNRWNDAMMARPSVNKALSMVKEEDVKG
jgi:glutathione S-transferase